MSFSYSAPRPATLPLDSSSLTTSSYAIPSPPSPTSSSLDSLPDSASSSDIDSDDEEEESDAEREWKESLQQLELLLTMVLVPYVGKYFGRKAAYWGELLGLGKGVSLLGRVCARAVSN